MPDRYLTPEEIADYKLVTPLLENLHSEMSELSRKKQDGALNKLKIRHINRILVKVEAILGDDPSVVYLEKLDEDDVPQNSDAVVVLGQWRAAMKQFQSKHTSTRSGTMLWKRGNADEAK
jgi:hypothetical protein